VSLRDAVRGVSLPTLRGMTLCASDRTVPTVKVATLTDVRDGFLDVHGLQTTEEGQSVDADVEEPGIDFTKGVAREYPRALL
jgi:hypothetical protein